MENTTDIYHHDWESEPEEDLSFGDLPIFLCKEPERNTYYHNDDDRESRNSFSSQDFFEFSPPNDDDQNSKTNPEQDMIIFFGRNILHNNTNQSTNSPNPFVDRSNSRNPFSRSTQLWNRSSSRSHSLHIETSKPSPTPPSTRSFRDQYQSSKHSRKHKVMIGLAKIPPKMELSDIKKRQSRQAPAPMIPPVVLADADEKPLVDGTRRSGKGSQKCRGELAKPLKCRTYVSGSFAKTCFKGCIPIFFQDVKDRHHP